MAVAVVLMILAAACTSGGPPKKADVIARIKVVDSPNYMDELYRYVVWRGENYGPAAFEKAARRTVGSLLLEDAGDAGLRCIAALSGALAIPAHAVNDSTGMQDEIVASGEDVGTACGIPRNVPTPELAQGQYYVHATDAGVAIAGEAPGLPATLVKRIAELKATAIVLHDSSIAGIMCFSEIARAAGVQLLNVHKDGSAVALSVKIWPAGRRSDLLESCDVSPERSLISDRAGLQCFGSVTCAGDGRSLRSIARSPLAAA